MKQLLLITSAICAFYAVTTTAMGEPVTAGTNWNSSAGWLSAYQKLVLHGQADQIKKAENGYYDGFDSNYYYISSTTVGNLVTFENSQLTDVTVTTTNCGNISSQNQAGSHSDNSTTNSGINCQTGE